MNTNDIDKTYIVALQEVNGMLQNVTLPISRPEQFIDELKAMIENPNRTVWDMQSHFQTIYPKTSDYHNYLNPYSYSSSYVGGVGYPDMIGYNNLKKSWDEAAKSAQKEYEDICNRIGKTMSDSELEEYRKSAIENIKYRQKASFNSDALRWIDACCYNNAANKAHRDNSIKMFSKENIGWSSFKHKVNENIIVELHTNFGYGSAAYFLLAIKYKGLSILPYSYIVKYYKAGMMDIVRCTRSYFACRESWCAAFDFLSDFVNKSISNPENFVKSYIMHEVEEMMDGLEAIEHNPARYISRIKNNKSEPCVINMRPMLSDDETRLASYPEEIPTLFKVEKIMGALEFLKSLKDIAKEVECIQPYIDRLIKLNMDLYPEIQAAITKIKRKVKEQILVKESLDVQISELAELLKPYDNEIMELKSKATKNNPFSMTDYKETHSGYADLKEKEKSAKSKRNDVNQLIKDLNFFIDTLNKSLSQLEKFMAKNAA